MAATYLHKVDGDHVLELDREVRGPFPRQSRPDSGLALAGESAQNVLSSGILAADLAAVPRRARI